MRSVALALAFGASASALIAPRPPKVASALSAGLGKHRSYLINLGNDSVVSTFCYNIVNKKNLRIIDISNYKINIDIKSSQSKQNIIEVLISLSLIPIKDDFEKIATKIVYASIIELEKDKLTKEELERIILIEVPSRIYPELRKIFIFLFENSGFKDVKINESVDFEKLYKMKKFQ